MRKYRVSVVCRDEVSAFKPYLWHESEFEKVGITFTQSTTIHVLLPSIGRSISRMASDEDYKWGKSKLFGSQIRTYAGMNLSSFV